MAEFDDELFMCWEAADPGSVSPPDFALRMLEIPGGSGSTDGLLGIQIDPGDQTIGARPSKVSRPTSAAVAYSSTEEAVGVEVAPVSETGREARVDTSPTEIIRPPTDSEKSTMVDYHGPVPEKRRYTFAMVTLAITAFIAIVYVLFA